MGKYSKYLEIPLPARLASLAPALALSGLLLQPAFAVCPQSASELAEFIESCGGSACPEMATTCNDGFSVELKSVTTVGSVVTFEYEVCRINSAAGLSHFVIDLGCPVDAVVDCEDCEVTDNDPTTGLGGIKFDGAGSQCETFTLSIDQNLLPSHHAVNVGCVTVSTKAGNQVLGSDNSPGYACVAGPVCIEVPVSNPSCGVEGEESVCANTPTLEYSALTDSDNPSFAWEVTFGDAVIVSDPNQETVTVDAGEESFTLQVTITDPEGGESTCTLDVTVEAVPSATIINVDPELTCAEESIELCVETDAVDPTFAWSKDGSPIEDATDACLTITDPGEYCIAVTNASDCTTTACIMVGENRTPPDIEVLIDPAQLTCDVLESTLTASSSTPGVTFAWSGPDGDIAVIDPSANPNIIVVNKAGVYSCVVTDGENSCTADQAVEVLGFEPVDADIEGEEPITCNTPTVNVCASYTPTTATVTFAWSGPNDFSADTECVDITEPGEYCVVVTDVDTNCSDTVCVTIDEILPPSCEIVPPETAPDCGSEDNILSANVTNGEGTINYLWAVVGDGWEITAGQGTDMILYTAGEPGTSGEFTLTVTDELGCESECTITLTCLGGELFCSYTQGFWGNKNGLALMEVILEGTQITVGLPGRSLTVTGDGAECLNSAMPMGGKPAALPDNTGDLLWDDLSCILGRRDKFGNVLVGQTVALTLNVLNDPELCDFELCPIITTQGAILVDDEYQLDPGPDGMLLSDDDPIETHAIPQKVLDALDTLGLPQTVCGLLELANRAVGGSTDLGGASHSQISDAAEAINEAFDECRILLICADEEPTTE